MEPLLKAAGVKAWKTFAKSAVCVEVEEQDGQLEFVPTVNLGGDEGFQAYESKKTGLTLPAASERVDVPRRWVVVGKLSEFVERLSKLPLERFDSP